MWANGSRPAIVAEQSLRTLVASPGLALTAGPADLIAEPEPGAAATDMDTHGELLALKDRASVAEGVAALAATQSRANPELTIATTRDRGASGETWQQTFTVGVRIPFGAGPRHDARTAAARSTPGVRAWKGWREQGTATTSPGSAIRRAHVGRAGGDHRVAGAAESGAGPAGG